MVPAPTRSRVRLMANDVALVERLSVSGPRTPRPLAESYSQEFQICLPFEGTFFWHVGRDDVVADPNRVLFVTGGEGFRLSQPVPGNWAELIVTVRPPLLAELLGVAEGELGRHATFRERSRMASADLQRLAAACVHGRPARIGRGLAQEEWLLDFLRAAIAAPPAVTRVTASTRRIISRAKVYLAANLGAPVRLADVAAAAGASPAYLTTVFRRVEGRSLHRYLVQLRLARALVALPDAPDLTTLAGDLGFSHHSHFTAAFRRAFGCTPSAFRAEMRQGRPPTHVAAWRRALGA